MINEKTANVLKVRAFVLKKARSWFEDNNYVEVQAPILIPALSRSSTSFRLKYYDRSAYLTKGFLPYGRAFAEKLGKVYTITPSFRYEKVRTRRHLSEFWRVEAVQKGSLGQIIDAQEDLVTFVCSSLGDFKETVLSFNRSWRDFEKFQKPFDRVTYDEAIEILQKDRHHVWWGQEIDWRLERILSLKFDKPFFVTKIPFCSETLFGESDSRVPEVSLYADLLAPEGYGEIASSLQMVSGSEAMIERLREAEVSRKNREWFSSFFLSSSPRFSGFALGVERLLQWICKLPEIKEATAFPRTEDAIYP